MYTDGVTEAVDESEAEFGENRLLATLEEQRDVPAPVLLEAIIDRVQQFQHGKQSDDVTLIVARCHE
jgi:serine phosphatase RsbU (regulator of sigma subunit)